jgi:hypothetical protein
MVDVADRFPGSVTLTTNVLVPTSEEPGVPETEPSLATLSHDGPLTFAKVSGSPFRSVASAATVAE